MRHPQSATSQPVVGQIGLELVHRFDAACHGDQRIGVDCGHEHVVPGHQCAGGLFRYRQAQHRAVRQGRDEFAAGYNHTQRVGQAEDTSQRGSRILPDAVP